VVTVEGMLSEFSLDFSVTIDQFDKELLVIPGLNGEDSHRELNRSSTWGHFEVFPDLMISTTLVFTTIVNFTVTFLSRPAITVVRPISKWFFDTSIDLCLTFIDRNQSSCWATSLVAWNID